MFANRDDGALGTARSQPDFLTEKSLPKAVFFILACCKISTIRDHKGCYDRLEPLVAGEWRGNGDQFRYHGTRTQP